MRRRDRGTATIEFVGLMPLLLLTIVIALQVMSLAYAAHGASQAARDGARAYSLGQSPDAAVRASLPGNVQLVSVSASGPRHTVRVVVQATTVWDIGAPQITREVTMP